MVRSEKHRPNLNAQMEKVRWSWLSEDTNKTVSTVTCVHLWYRYPKFNGSHFSLVPKLYPQNDWTGWQNGVNDYVIARAPSTKYSHKMYTFRWNMTEMVTMSKLNWYAVLWNKLLIFSILFNMSVPYADRKAWVFTRPTRTRNRAASKAEWSAFSQTKGTGISRVIQDKSCTCMHWFLWALHSMEWKLTTMTMTQAHVCSWCGCFAIFLNCVKWSCFQNFQFNFSITRG